MIKENAAAEEEERLNLFVKTREKLLKARKL
jgi:hypothetical protein